MKQPRLGVKPGAGRVVRHAHLRAELRRASIASASVEPVKTVVRTRSGLPSSMCRRSASINGLMPVRRMNAITRSIRSADAISA